MKKTLWTLTSAAALLCVAAMATAEAPVATGETAWLRGKPVATVHLRGQDGDSGQRAGRIRL